MKNDLPKVSCLMVTANRLHLMKRAIHCYNQQTYSNKEIVIVDDGEQDLSEALSMVPPSELKYIKLEPESGNVLGTLRNISLENATGKYIAQWDDDDWFHPDKLRIQIQFLEEGYDVCCLPGAIMHLNKKEFVHKPYVGMLPNGVPGSIIHRKNPEIRYPDTRRAEDTVFLEKWSNHRYKILPEKYCYLFVRCYHGNNTWEVEHFLRRIKNSPKSFIQFYLYKYVLRNLFRHPKFKLSKLEKTAFEEYVKDSKIYGLLDY